MPALHLRFMAVRLLLRLDDLGYENGKDPRKNSPPNCAKGQEAEADAPVYRTGN